MRRAIVLVSMTAIAVSSLGAASARPQVQRPASPASAPTTADEVLARAVSLFEEQPAARAEAPSAVPGTRSATMVLRDLLFVRDDLSPAKRRVADRLLARPTDGGQDPFGDGYSTPALATERDTCTELVPPTHFCIHWVELGPDAPDNLTTDTNMNTIPDWVDTNVTVFDQVWAQEIDTLGFRPPKSDAHSPNHGPNNKLDVYLADIGNQGFYGYCTSDDPNLDRPGYRFWNFSAFCVIDEDFAEFPLPGLPSLRVTAAHEFFHASQFAYDIGEDLWLMEGTAVWMEDEVFDGVNDHLQYLAASQLRRPWVPVDLGASGYRYGAWIYWRFLSERFDTGIVKKVWLLADGAQGARNRDSLRAAVAGVQSRGSTFRAAFAEFGAWNVRPSSRYEEGRRYGLSRVSRTHTVTGANGGIGWKDLVLDHLSHREIVFRPGAGVHLGARLRVRIDGPPLGSGTEATVVIRSDDGRVRFFRLGVDSDGTATRTVPFGGDVDRATLVLTNASTRTRCWRNTAFSCQGSPRDDDELFSYSGALVP